MREWIIEALKDPKCEAYDDACCSLAEIVAEAEYEEPGSSDQIYEWLWEEHGIEL